MNEKDGWIKWNGGERPVPLYTRIEIKFRDGDILPGIGDNDLRWRHIGTNGDIIAYRVLTEENDNARD